MNPIRWLFSLMASQPCGRGPTRGAERLRLLPLLLTTLALASCGGGVSVGIGIGGDFDHSPPSVTLTASATRVVAGQTLRLIAAAADESGIESVGFYSLENGQSRSLGTLTRPPYDLSVTAPVDGRSVWTVFARAYDNAGNRADSASIDIAVTR